MTHEALEEIKGDHELLSKARKALENILDTDELIPELAGVLKQVRNMELKLAAHLENVPTQETMKVGNAIFTGEGVKEKINANEKSWEIIKAKKNRKRTQ